MNSPKNKTQQQRTKIKNLSALERTLLAIGLALVTRQRRIKNAG